MASLPGTSIFAMQRKPDLRISTAIPPCTATNAAEARGSIGAQPCGLPCTGTSNVFVEPSDNGPFPRMLAMRYGDVLKLSGTDLRLFCLPQRLP